MNRLHVAFNEGLYGRIWAIGKNLLPQFAVNFLHKDLRKWAGNRSIWRFESSLHLNDKVSGCFLLILDPDFLKNRVGQMTADPNAAEEYP